MFELPSEDERQPEDLMTRRANTACLSPIELEAFLHNRLSGTTRESIEEHLLYCHACLDRVQDEESFAAAAQAAARRIELEDLNKAWAGSGPGVWAKIRNWLRRPWGAGLMLTATAALVTLLVAPSLRQPAAMDVSLSAERGLSSGLSSTAEAGHPLRLNLDAVGLPETGLHIELVRSGGAAVAESAAAPSAGRLHWDLGRGLDAGGYWVRVYSRNQDTLLREYALTVK